MMRRFWSSEMLTKAKVVRAPRIRPHRLQARSQSKAQLASGALETTTVTVEGAELELISTPRTAKYTKGLPPILFLHGAAHGAWCWAEHFLPWFAGRGCECHALSFRGHVRFNPHAYTFELPIHSCLCHSIHNQNAAKCSMLQLIVVHFLKNHTMCDMRGGSGALPIQTLQRTILLNAARNYHWDL
jgi:hypothetical protein